MNKSIIKNRTEILFVYDITDANPNGDPNDENRPRMDVETGLAKVSDVRLKRTVRDYLYDYSGEEIFCREIEKPDGTIQEGKDRAEDFFDQVEEAARKKAKNVLEKRNLIQAGVLEKCIDVRLFGATIPVGKIPTNKNEKDSSVTLTGPVQFAMGSSLHRVEPRFIKGTGAFASGQGAQQKTFREEYVLPYALISFYGIVNQQAAKTTGLSAEDVERLYEAMWYGTKNLITRSKIGQRPLLLVLVEYKTENANSYIGRLDRFLSLSKDNKNGTVPRDEELREVQQGNLNLESLSKAINSRKEKIARIRFAWDERLPLSHRPAKSNGKWTFLGCPAEKLEFE
ncbi:MAG: type I-B CRISPR-associated protein Cas7/Csh2 [Acidobacteria bacterium]|nr:type I-B CRISPR-associated protein Cas7/Csh2 [Acidobacteriota bacterium]